VKTRLVGHAIRQAGFDGRKKRHVRGQTEGFDDKIAEPVSHQHDGGRWRRNDFGLQPGQPVGAGDKHRFIGVFAVLRGNDDVPIRPADQHAVADLDVASCIFVADHR
jgi:hypothetical protein